MVEYADHGKDVKTRMEYPIFSRKHRQLIPRLSLSSSTLSTFPAAPCCRIHDHHFLTGYGALPLVSTRWNPTREQLEALEEMYRRGIRTPTAEQIREIAGRLGRYGKIQGKNVFYWFQNHKARERQKKKRQLDLLSNRKIDSLQPTHTGLLSKKYMQSEHPKKLVGPASSNCRTTPSEGSVSRHRAAESECEAAELMTLFHLNLQQKTAAKNRDISCKLELSSCMSAQRSYPLSREFCAVNLGTSSPSKNDDLLKFEHSIEENDRILQLFPVRNINEIADATAEEEDAGAIRSYQTKSRVNYEFFEFLPIKN